MSESQFTPEQVARVSELLEQFNAALVKFQTDMARVAQDISAQLADLNKEKI